ncbi:putative bifunctional diguanylate cyclase/phosphodiesterase [[Erwinia] mediterraneensis]|uniref:putative bifunctional diguanylate cyclase/phosphodiesterase n=1 Tax=[Erwinia] mediterraneensis TaxID=2161819 RepID=UPI001030AFA6|nr:EAL domain-containing protein [[Erwinia] mediterraneensis]
MINPTHCTAGFRRNFWREVLLPLLAILILTFAGAWFGMYSSAALSNQEAQRQQQHMIEASFAQTQAEHLRQLRSLTRWNELDKKLHLNQRDEAWLNENVGDWLWRMFGHQLTLALDAHGQVIGLWRNGQAQADKHSGLALQQLLQKQRALQDSALPDSDTVDLVRIGQQAAVVAVSNIASSQAHTDRYRLVSLKFLDEAYLRALASRSQLQDLHFTDSNMRSDHKAHYQLLSQQGEPVGYISWLPVHPGQQMLRTVGPITALAVLVITLLCLYMSRRIWTSSLHLSQSMLKLAASEAQAQHLAFHDVLTGLPNRALVEDRLTQALALATRQQQQVALLLIDLDRFKSINDTYGHKAGDDLIIEVSHRLCALVRASDTVGRIGGDEFIIVMPAVEHLAQVQALSKRIIEALAQPVVVLGSEAWIGASIGLTLAPQDGMDRQELMRKADIALYEAKNGGRGQYRQFEAAMDESVRTRQMIAADLRNALRNYQGLAVWYQPLMDINGQQVVGLEALLRWQHPTRGDITPGEFIAIAEETGLIIPLGEWVLHEACQVAQRYPQLVVAVNISPVQFRASGFVQRTIEIVQEAGSDPQHIELEITEGVLIEDEREARAIIIALREAGFRIALDDFGTGYSSLNYLSHFPVDKIKIDRSFTQSLGVAENSTAIVESVVKLGHAMGLTVTAEGVETDSQMSALADAGCNQLQGYLFSQAVPLEQLPALIAPENAILNAQ